MYTHEKFAFRPMAWLLIVAAIFLVFIQWYKEAAICGSIGTFVAISFKGINIDAKNMRIRKYDRFFGFYIGEWKDIERPLYLTVVRIKLSSKRALATPMVGPADDTSVRTYKMNLVVDTSQRFIPIMRGKRMFLLEEGLKISRLLNIRLLDHTGSEKRWIV